MDDTNANIDLILSALADPVRRDIFERVSQAQLTVNQIAIEYDMSLAAVSKHIRILREAGLVSKRRQGRYQFVSANIAILRDAVTFFTQFESESSGPFASHEGAALTGFSGEEA